MAFVNKSINWNSSYEMHIVKYLNLKLLDGWLLAHWIMIEKTIALNANYNDYDYDNDNYNFTWCLFIRDKMIWLSE